MRSCSSTWTPTACSPSPTRTKTLPSRTPLYDRHLALGGRLVDFAGWEMPQQYSSVRDEHAAVRQAAGLFDVSHMGRVAFRGERAGEFLQRLVTNDLGGVEPGHAQYNLICRPDGGVIDDVIVYRQPDGAWTMVVNASNREKDTDWMREQAPAGVEVLDQSQETALLAFQGPGAASVLGALTPSLDLAPVPAFGVVAGEVAGVAGVTLSRTGYTGEDGFEIFLPAARAGAVWDAILEAGAAQGVRPAGLAARDVCRLEAGMRLYGNDMDEATNPYQAGLGWTVKLDKGEFLGRDALREVKATGPDRVIVGIRCADRVIPRHGAAVKLEGEPIGEVTSGTHSFFLGAGIGMASVATGRAPVGSQVEVEGRGPAGGAEVVKLPFYRGSVKTAAAGAAKRTG
ncbi:MAG: glycine cleavage system aminomethyltransferase GcvT [Chloroflexota bacterium]